MDTDLEKFSVFSIRWKLFFFTAFLSALFVLFAVISNAFFIGDYYLSQKKAALKQSADEIIKALSADEENAPLEIEKITRTYGVHLVLFD